MDADRGGPQRAQRRRKQGRIRTWWSLVYQMVHRVSAMVLWWPYLVFLFVLFLVDGLVTRKIRQTGFQLASPLRHRLSLYLLEFVFIAGLVVLVVPVALHPGVVMAAIVLAGVLLRVSIGNFLKRVWVRRSGGCRGGMGRVGRQ